MRGYGIEEVAVETRIPVQHLKRIEEELFKGLPPPVYTRGFVSGYAAFLAIDPFRAAKDFMNRLQRWKKQESGRSPSRRFRLSFWNK
jgi:cytoskeletal protein RodZ